MAGGGSILAADAGVTLAAIARIRWRGTNDAPARFQKIRAATVRSRDQGAHKRGLFRSR
jgi:hypothetical protein